MSAFYELRPRLDGRDAEFWSDPQIAALTTTSGGWMTELLDKFSSRPGVRVLAISPVSMSGVSVGGDSPTEIIPFYAMTVLYQERTMPQENGS